MLHFSKLQPQRAPGPYAHRDRVSQGRLRQVLSSGALRTVREESFQLQLQLKVQQVPAFPAL